MRKFLMGLAVCSILAMAGPRAAQADLVFLGLVDLTGQGLGTVNTVLTLQSPGRSQFESGQVLWEGTATGCDPTKSNAAGCESTGAFFNPATGSSANDAPNGAAQNNAYEIGDVVPSGSTLRIILNTNEPRADSLITLQALSLFVYDSVTGAVVQEFKYNGYAADGTFIGLPQDIAAIDPGVGNAGYAFGLDAAQTAIFLSLAPTGIVGLGAAFSNAQGGVDTFSIQSAPLASVPEPMSLALFGTGLLGLGFMRRRRRAEPNTAG